MACSLTQSYLQDCRLNYGGIKECYVIELDNISTITEAAGVITAITKVSLKTFKKYNLIAHTAEAEDVLSSSLENGTSSSKQSLKFPINKMTISVRNEIQLLAQNRLVWVIVDNNSTNWLYGKEFGMVLTSAGGKTGKALNDRNGFEFVFEGEEKVLAYEVDDATLATLTT